MDPTFQSYVLGIFPYIGLIEVLYRPYIWYVPPIQDPEMAIDICFCGEPPWVQMGMTMAHCDTYWTLYGTNFQLVKNNLDDSANLDVWRIYIPGRLKHIYSIVYGLSIYNIVRH